MNRKALIAMFFILQFAVIALSAGETLPLAEERSIFYTGQNPNAMDASFFWKKDDEISEKENAFTEAKKSLTGTIDASDLEEAIDEACKKAVRNEESYLEGLVKETLAPLKEQALRSEESRQKWIHAGIAEGIIILLEGIALAVAVRKKSN